MYLPIKGLPWRAGRRAGGVLSRTLSFEVSKPQCHERLLCRQEAIYVISRSNSLLGLENFSQLFLGRLMHRFTIPSDCRLNDVVSFCTIPRRWEASCIEQAQICCRTLQPSLPPTSMPFGLEEEQSSGHLPRESIATRRNHLLLKGLLSETGPRPCTNTWASGPWFEAATGCADVVSVTAFLDIMSLLKPIAHLSDLFRDSLNPNCSADIPTWSLASTSLALLLLLIFYWSLVAWYSVAFQ